MRLDIPDRIVDRTIDQSPRIGMVYRARGGRGLYRVIIGISPSQTYIFGIFDEDGVMTGVSTYGASYVRDLIPMGFCRELEDFHLVLGPLPIQGE